MHVTVNGAARELPAGTTVAELLQRSGAASGPCAVEIANRALDVLEMENRVRGEIRAGRTLSQVMELYRWEKAR